MAFLELPEVNEVGQDEVLFPWHIDYSLDFLLQHQNEIDNLIDKILDDPGEALKAQPYLVKYDGNPQENIDELKDLRNKVEDRLEDFFEWSASLAVSTCIYDPCPSTQATVFFERANGKLAVAKFDIFKPRMVEYTDPNFPRTLRELQSKEGMITVADAFPKDPAYLVTCASKRAPLEGIIVQSTMDITKEERKKHSGFYASAPDYSKGTDFEFTEVGGIFPELGLVPEDGHSPIKFPPMYLTVGSSSIHIGLN